MEEIARTDRERTDRERTEMDDFFGEALESDDPETRRVAAEGLLTFRLNNSFKRISEKQEIDLSYVSCAEYQLFLDDMRAQGEFYQPDHWSSYPFPVGQAQLPVSGIRPEDAQAFCKWLTRYENKERRYRLPNSEEAGSYPISNAAIAAWCRDLGEFNLVGAGNALNPVRENLKSLLNESNPKLSVLDLNPDLEYIVFSYSKFFRDYLMFPLAVIAIISYLYFSLSIFGISLPVFIVLSVSVYTFLYFITDGSVIDITAAIIANLLKLLILGPFVVVVFLTFCNFWFIVLIIYMVIGSDTFDWIGKVVSGVSEAFDDLAAQASEGIHTIIRKISGLLKGKQKTSEIPDSAPSAESLTNREISSTFEEKFNQQKSALIYYDHHSVKNKGDWVKRKKTNEIKLDIKHLRWLRVIMARKEGSLPAWEGIRLVRERTF